MLKIIYIFNVSDPCNRSWRGSNKRVKTKDESRQKLFSDSINFPFASRFEGKSMQRVDKKEKMISQENGRLKLTVMAPGNSSYSQ